MSGLVYTGVDTGEIMRLDLQSALIDRHHEAAFEAGGFIAEGVETLERVGQAIREASHSGLYSVPSNNEDLAVVRFEPRYGARHNLHLAERMEVTMPGGLVVVINLGSGALHAASTSYVSCSNEQQLDTGTNDGIQHGQRTTVLKRFSGLGDRFFSPTVSRDEFRWQRKTGLARMTSLKTTETEREAIVTDGLRKVQNYASSGRIRQARGGL